MELNSVVLTIHERESSIDGMPVDVAHYLFRVKVAAGAAECTVSYRSTTNEHKHNSHHTVHKKDTHLARLLLLPYTISQLFNT